MTPEEALALKDIAYRMIALATGETPAELPIAFPPGTVAVRPTGVLGQGKVRYWPQPLASVPPSGVPELCWAYCLRLTYTNRPDGEPYAPRIYRDQIGALFQAAAPGPTQQHLYPAFADRWIFPEDWWSAEEIERRRQSDSQWAETFRNMGA